MRTKSTSNMAVAALALGLTACGGTEPKGGPVDPDAYDGIGDVSAPLLAANCTVTSTQTSIVVAGGETLYVTLRPSDGKVTLNAVATGNGPCDTATGSKLVVTATGTTAHTVILDYVNGLFLKGVSAPGITIDLGAGTSDTIKIRGSAGVDRFAFGAGSTSGVYAFNFNQGTASTVPVGDSIVDVTWKGVENVIVSTGPGNDVLDASGVYGTGAAYPLALKLYGGAGNDTITGGAGNDYIVGGAGDDIIDGQGGDDTIYAGTASDGNDTINVTGTTPGNDIADYSGRVNDLTLNIDGTATSGETGETDKISDKVVKIIGGSGNDTITVGATSTVGHVIKGGLGDDIITGGAGNDLIDGEGGDDTMIGDHCTADYSVRTTAITVTVCDSSCGASNDDGDQAVTHIVASGAAGATGAAGGADADAGVHASATVTGLIGLSATSVGRNLVISASTGATDDGTYPILSFVDATSVTIDTNTNGSFAADVGPFTWKVVGAEKDNVQCANVSGGSGDDTLTGDARDNLLMGNDGNDTLIGGLGDDTLQGGNGNDNLYGGAGDDMLDGGPGNDNLYGGDDNDILSGGAGADVFTCDGKNTPAGTAGPNPGDSDFTVDFDASGGDTGGLDCEF